MFWVALVSYLFAFFAADRLCRARGLSLSRNSIETWDRMVADRERFVAPFLAVEYAFNRPTVIVNVCLSALICLLPTVLLVCLHTPDFVTSVIAIVSLVLFGGLGIQFVLAWDGCQVRIDHEGVYGYPARLALFRKLVPWTEIASCDIVTRRDASGRIYLIMPVFRNDLGKKLMSLSLRLVPMDYQERVVRYIKTKLPKAARSDR